MSELTENTPTNGTGTEAGTSGTVPSFPVPSFQQEPELQVQSPCSWPELGFGEDRDAIDALIEDLNEATGGALTFERDVLDVDRPEDWGAVEMTGTVDEWADGKRIDRAYRLDIWAAVSDRASEWLETVEDVLDAWGDRISYQLRERAYLHDLKKVVWRWDAVITTLEAPEDGDDDGQDDG
jgi:hypothetical protein